jgi:hypothetical protein
MVTDPDDLTRPIVNRDDAVPLYHYTCAHTFAALGHGGTLKPARHLTDAIPDEWWPADYVWATDLARPIRDALGLTQHLVTCDRTRFRYRVLEPWQFLPWMDLRPVAPNPSLLEVAGTRPRHWWVCPFPVEAVYEPRT